MDRRACLYYSRDMTIRRLDHVSVVVDDLAPAIAFFTALGMSLEGEATVEGPWVEKPSSPEFLCRVRCWRFQHSQYLGIYKSIPRL